MKVSIIMAEIIGEVSISEVLVFEAKIAVSLPMIKFFNLCWRDIGVGWTYPRPIRLMTHDVLIESPIENI